jgi:hypothetical protein
VFLRSTDVTTPEYISVVGYLHFTWCLVARHPDYGTWEDVGFPWCTCHHVDPVMPIKESDHETKK